MKKKGFTLVELLGVIVVLAIIVLIAVPTIIGIIEKSSKSSLQNSGYGLVEAGTLYYAHYQNSKTVRFDIKDNEITSKENNKLSYKGSIKEGTVLINNKGEVVVCINDGKYAAYKNFKDNKVMIVDNKTCTIPENSNIVYLDNEATVDMNIEELLKRIEELEKKDQEKDQKIEEQNEKIKKLENEKSNQIDVTTSINNLTNTHNTDMALLNNKLGNTNISSIGNGTITGAIQSLNNLASKNAMYLSTPSATVPWLAIKENWSSIPTGVSSGVLASAQDFGYIFVKFSDYYGTGLIFGYSSGWVWHVWGGINAFYYETVSVSGATQY